MSITIGTVTISRNPVYPLNWYPKRFNQYTRDVADGDQITYDNGPNVIYGILTIRNVSRTEGDALRTYLSGTAIFGKTSFLITPQAGGNTNLGRGTATAIGVFLNNGNTLDGIFTLVVPDLYTIVLPYRQDINYSYA